MTTGSQPPQPRSARLAATRRGGAVLAAEPPWLLLAIALVAAFAARLAAKFLAAPEVIALGPVVISHLSAASFAVAIGGAQLLPRLRTAQPQWHRWIGRCYLGASLYAGVTALYIASRMDVIDATAVGLAVTAALWSGSSLCGFWSIRRGAVARHRRWMLRSYAMALTVITIRLYADALLHTRLVDPATAQALASWAAWITNLAAAEWLAARLFAAPTRRAAPPPPAAPALPAIRERRRLPSRHS